MEALAQSLSVIDIVTKFGLPGLILLLWWANDRARAKDLKEWREDQAQNIKEWRDDVTKILAAYHEDATEARRFYDHNVKLVENYESIARDLHNTVVLNTQVITEVCEAVNTNQYCPLIRLDKLAKGPQG